MGKIGSKGEIGFCIDIISHFSLAIFSLLQLLCVFDFFLMLVHFDDVLKEPWISIKRMKHEEDEFYAHLHTAEAIFRGFCTCLFIR